MLRRIQILFPSLRNTVDAQLSLFEKLDSKVLVTCPSLAQPLKPLLSAAGKFRKIQVPSLDALLSDEPAPHYEYDETFETVSGKPVVFVHTSGSSGMHLAHMLIADIDEIAGNPKPITWNMTFINALDSTNSLPNDQSASLTKALTKHQNTLVLLPCFHVRHPLNQ